MITIDELRNTDFSDILGCSDAKRQLSSALIAGHHVILVGPPGVGKTTIAKNIAKLLPDETVNECQYNCQPDNPICPVCRNRDMQTKTIKGEERFVRIQGSPDLSVEDIFGDIDPVKALKYGSLSMEAFTPGKIFKANEGVLFFDEINRCPEKLQNSLLQVLEEGYVTLGSYTVDIPANFIFIATMNPEDTSTEKLSDVLLDRFDMVYLSYPETQEIENEIVKEKGKSIAEFPDELLDYMTGFIRDLRHSDKLEKLPSVRASLGLFERSQANALIQGRKRVNHHDIHDAVRSVLGHRISFKPSIKYLKEPSEFLEEQIRSYSRKQKTEEGDVP